MMKRALVVGALISALAIMLSCGGSVQEPVSGPEEERIKSELSGRSFRQFEPSKDSSPRKGVILDFFNGIRLWAQYAEDGHAKYEWEIYSTDYRIESRGEGSELEVLFVNPKSMQGIPAECESCIETSGLSISIREIFDSEKISFKVNDPEGDLPLPFPVFGGWTKFEEDEYFE